MNPLAASTAFLSGLNSLGLGNVLTETAVNTDLVRARVADLISTNQLPSRLAPESTTVFQRLVSRESVSQAELFQHLGTLVSTQRQADVEQAQKRILLQSGLADGSDWRQETRHHAIGLGVSHAVRNNEGPLQAVTLASFNVAELVPEILRGRPQALERILRNYFTENELNEDNLGLFRKALKKDKYYSRIVGLLSLKAAIFRAAGLPLPGEEGGEPLKWTDIEYVREAYTTSAGQTRYRRVRTFQGEIGRALNGRGLFTNFTDDSDTGMAIAVVEREAGKSGLVSLGLDITHAHRFASSDEAVAHAQGEAAYKATYFGGHQAFYLDNVIQDIHAVESVSPGRTRYKFTGLTGEAMRNLGGSHVVGTEIKQADLVSSLMVVRGVSKIGPAPLGAISAPLEVKPALAQAIDNGDVNVIFQYPGQAGEFAAFLADKWLNDPEARAIILARARDLHDQYGIDFDALISSAMPASELASSAISQPLIGLAQELANFDFKRMGYNFGKPNVTIIGHSQGQVLALNAIDAVTGPEVVNYLGLNGKLMQAADPYYGPEVGDPLNLAAFMEIPSKDQLPRMLEYTGKISMINTGGINRRDLNAIVDAVLEEMRDEEEYARAASLVNTEADPERYAKLIPFEVDLPDDPSLNNFVISGTTRVLKEIARRVVEANVNYKVRVALTTAGFHSDLMQDGFTESLSHLVGKRLGELPTAVLLNHDGTDLRTITGTVKVPGPDGREIEIDARIHAVMKGQYVNPVEWPTVVYKAFGMGDPTKPTIVIDGGPGKGVANMTEKLLTDRHGRKLATVICLGTNEGRAMLESGDLSAVPLVDPRTFTDPNYRPLVKQPATGHPIFDPAYAGAIGYLDELVLADPVKRRDFIKRAGRALNMDSGGDPRFHSEFLEKLGYDPSMPLSVAAMTGNTKAELIAAMAAEHYLCFLATTTFGGHFKGLAAEFERIHEMTKEKLRAKGDPHWEQGAPFGANLIHADPFDSWKKQIAAITEAKKKGIPINVVSIAFSKIELPDWETYYAPLLELGITLVPLGENENRWDHFLNNIYPNVPKPLRHLLSIAPEGAEGGGHNVPLTSGAIRYGRDLAKSLLKRGGIKNDGEGISIPWFMTGGQSTPQALADSLLVMADQPLRGGMQVGGIMQVALESTPPKQVKEFIAAAMAGEHDFVQVSSEFDRKVNLVDNRFSRAYVELDKIFEDVATRDIESVVANDKDEPLKFDENGRPLVDKGGEKTRTIKWGDPIGRERAEKAVDVLMRVPVEMRTLLHGMWVKGLSDFNRHVYEWLMQNVWPLWLAGDRDGMVEKLTHLSPRQVIVLYRSYRTWLLADPNCDPEESYVLGGRSIRALGRALEAEGQDPRKYLMMSGPEIFRDLRDRTVKYLFELYQRATAMEEAEQDKFAVASVDDLKQIPGVSIVSESALEEGAEGTIRVKFGKDLDAEKWRKALQVFGHGPLSRVLRTEKVSETEKENPILRTVTPEAGDQIEIIRRQEGGQVLLEGIRVFDRSKRLVAEILPSADHQAVNETWYLEQKDGQQDSPVTWRYEVRTGLTGLKGVVLVPGETAAQGREAYMKRWVGADVAPIGNLGDPVTTEHEVTAADVAKWNDEMGAKSATYRNPRQAGGIKIHPTYPLRAAWRSMMLAGMHSDADIDYLKVIHSSQTQRLGAPVKIGDKLTATSQVVRIENNPLKEGTEIAGREATIVTTVVNQEGEWVAEYQTQFLSRVRQPKHEVIFEKASALPMAPRVPLLEVSPKEVYHREGISFTRKDITGYSIDDQWLHTNDRFARRVGFKNGIIAQGWSILHTVSHSVIEGYLKNDASRFIGFGEGTAVTGAVLPGEKLTLEVDRIGFRGDREILAFRLVPEAGGNAKAVGTIELGGLPDYAGVFPGNASQREGMAKDLYLAGGIGRNTLVEATNALGEGGALLLDIITGGVSIPEGDVARKAAYDQALADKWIHDVVNSSPANLATSIAYYHARVEAGFPPPSLVSGHSLGQYTAAVAAGAMELEDAMRLVRVRGELMRKHAQGKIAAVQASRRLDPADIQKRLSNIRRAGEILELANINTITDQASQVVISGTEAAVLRAKQALELEKGRITVLSGNIAFHSSLVRAMEAEFREAIGVIRIDDPKVPVASIVEPGRLLRTADEVREELVVLNHESVQWDPSVRAMTSKVSSFVEFGAGLTLSNMIGRIAPDRPSGSVSDSKKKADELIFGDRPKPKAPPAPLPTPKKEGTEAAPVAQVKPEPTPAPYTSLDMAVLDLRLSTALVDIKDEVIQSATVSPLAPKVGATPSQFTWANMVLSLAESFPAKVVPSTLTPETRLDKDLGMDSLEVATYFGLVRNRNGIARMPTDDEVKRLETGTLADVFALTASYWDHPGEALDIGDIGKRGDPIGTPGKTYKEILDEAGIKGREVFTLVANGKLKSDTPGLFDYLLKPVFEGADDGALAGLADHVKRIEGWQFHEKFAAQAANLKDFKLAAYPQGAPMWEAQRASREERNAEAQALSHGGPMPSRSGAAMDKMDKKEVARLARREAAGVVKEALEAQRGARKMEVHPKTHDVVAQGGVAAIEDAARLALIREETSREFVDMLVHRWSGRVHAPWTDIPQNIAPANLLRLFTDISTGRLERDSEEGRFRIRHLANQVDRLRIDLALSLAELAEGRGLDDVGQALREVARQGEASLFLEALEPERKDKGPKINADEAVEIARSEGLSEVAETLGRIAADEGHQEFSLGLLPQPIHWKSTRMEADYGSAKWVREVSRNLTPSQVLDQWEREKLVDTKTIADLRALTKGQVSYRGKKVMIYGGTGTISKPTVEFFMMLGAEVWITTRQKFGDAEKIAREIRVKAGVRGSALHVTTGFEPSYSNLRALQGKHEEINWRPDIILNGMASEDYGPITEKLDFHKVSHVLVDSFRYAVGQYINGYKGDPKNSPTLAVGNQRSPNDKFALALSGSYPIAKAAMPEGQWAQRRDSEGLFYSDGRKIIREVTVDTGGVVPPSQKGIMGEFRKNGDALERTARAEGSPLWIFNGGDMGAINVAAFNPVYGQEDQIDRGADGGFRAFGEREGGLQGLLVRVRKEEDGKHSEAAKNPQESKKTSYHPFQDGQLRTPKDFGFFIDEVDGAEGVANPYSEVKDEDLVVIGADMATSFGPDAISSFMNLLERVGGYEGPWGQHLGLLWTAKAMGLDVAGKSPSEVQQMFGAEIYANMGPRPLKADNGQRPDAYKTFEITKEADEVIVGTTAEFEAARVAPANDARTKKLKKRVADLLRSGYDFEEVEIYDNDAEEPGWVKRILAKKADAVRAREITIQIGPLVVADLTPIDWKNMGAEEALRDQGARHIMGAQMALSNASRQAGLLPNEFAPRHGKNNISTIVSNGMGALNVVRNQQQNPRLQQDPGERAVVYGIPSAAAGRTGQDIFGAMGPSTDTPGACNTGPTSVWHAKQYFEAADKRASAARKRANEETDPPQKAVLEMEAQDLEEAAENMVVALSTGDDAATVETNILFERVGAMLTQKQADAKEFPLDVQQRPHDKGRIPGFQSGVGFGGLIIVRGKAVKKHGYTPLAVVRAADIGADGPRREPDGKTRAPTGLGRWGQRKVFYGALREARLAGLTPEQIEQQNSHSTGTGGDPAQSESYLVARVEETVDWAIKLVASGSDRYPQLAALIKNHGLNAMDLMKLDVEEKVRRIGLSVDKPETMMEEVIQWPRALKKELGLQMPVFESHPKGSGFRHTLGGTLVEFVSLIMQSILRRTLPHPGLNNVIDSTGKNPVATTLTQTTDLKPVFGEGANYRVKPAQASKKRRGLAQNSFGFNGLDGYIIGEVPEGMRFKTRADAVKWFTDNVRTHARAIALYRARNDGKMPAILPYEYNKVEKPQDLYTDTKEVYENAAKYAESIVNREDFLFPWEEPSQVTGKAA